MGKFYDEIPQSHFEWIEKQHMFFVATAPLTGGGHVNVSPKGTADSFHVVNSKQVWYEDLTGSGIETISHVRENGRITIMFCAFDGPPRILRLFGIGTVHEYGSDAYNALIPATARKPGSRAAIVIDIYQVGTSCGFAVPLYDFVMHRTQLLRTADKIEDADRERVQQRQQSGQQAAAAEGDTTKPVNPMRSLHTYWSLKNVASLDGLPGLLTAQDAIFDVAPLKNWDKDVARPTMRRNTGNTTGDASRDRKWFVSGFALGAVAVFAMTRLAGNLRG